MIPHPRLPLTPHIHLTHLIRFMSTPAPASALTQKPGPARGKPTARPPPVPANIPTLQPDDPEPPRAAFQSTYALLRLPLGPPATAARIVKSDILRPHALAIKGQKPIQVLPNPPPAPPQKFFLLDLPRLRPFPIPPFSTLSSSSPHVVQRTYQRK